MERGSLTTAILFRKVTLVRAWWNARILLVPSFPPRMDDRAIRFHILRPQTRHDDGVAFHVDGVAIHLDNVVYTIWRALRPSRTGPIPSDLFSSRLLGDGYRWAKVSVLTWQTASQMDVWELCSLAEIGSHMLQVKELTRPQGRSLKRESTENRRRGSGRRTSKFPAQLPSFPLPSS